MGGKDRNGIDCSRLIFESLKPVFGDFSGEICAEDFTRANPKIEKKDAQIGDFVSLKSGNGIANHIGVITSTTPEIRIIQASQSNGKVVEGRINYQYPLFYRNSYIIK